MRRALVTARVIVEVVDVVRLGLEPLGRFRDLRHDLFSLWRETARRKHVRDAEEKEGGGGFSTVMFLGRGGGVPGKEVVDE